MKPAYDKLGEEFASSSSVAIVDVDCTKEQDLCSKVGSSLVEAEPSPLIFGSTKCVGTQLSSTGSMENEKIISDSPGPE